MKTSFNSICAFVTIVALAGACQTGNKSGSNQSDSLSMEQEDSLLLERFAHGELRTNWEKHAIPLDSVFDGGPGKNDIPAIDFPRFVSIAEARSFLSEPDFGILLELNREQKFYPLNILNWHEVVNDEIGGRPVAVTFCPLCGSAIVYNRMVGLDTMLFGVSGKLYESNLLMFDHKTESLWLQASGDCLVGDLAGKKIELVNSVLISYEDLMKIFPGAKVLSTDTGFDRNYFQYPYADYNSSEELYFPVGELSNRFENKDEMYVVKAGDATVAFHWLTLLKSGRAKQSTRNGVIEVSVKDFVPVAINKSSGEKLPGYFSYWFSWYATFGKSGVVWPQ